MNMEIELCIDIDNQIYIDIIKELKEEEGFSPTLYLDSLGNYTIGYGTKRNLYDYEKERLNIKRLLDIVEVSKQEAEYLLINEVNELIKKFLNLEWFRCKPGIVQKNLIKLAYNVGFTGTLKFKKMIRNLITYNFTGAMIEMLDSKHLEQVKGRNIRYALEIGYLEKISIENSRKIYEILEYRIGK